MARYCLLSPLVPVDRHVSNTPSLGKLSYCIHSVLPNGRVTTLMLMNCRTSHLYVDEPCSYFLSAPHSAVHNSWRLPCCCYHQTLMSAVGRSGLLVPPYPPSYTPCAYNYYLLVVRSSFHHSLLSAQPLSFLAIIPSHATCRFLLNIYPESTYCHQGCGLPFRDTQAARSRQHGHPIIETGLPGAPGRFGRCLTMDWS